MADAPKVGDRVRVNESLIPGPMGSVKVGTMGRIIKRNIDGTVFVEFDDKRVGWLASWEVDVVVGEN